AVSGPWASRTSGAGGFEVGGSADPDGAVAAAGGAGRGGEEGTRPTEGTSGGAFPGPPTGGADLPEGIVGGRVEPRAAGLELETDSIRRAAASLERRANGDGVGRTLACGAGVG
ncbi:MAG: hypothetical protein JRN08_08885, partial [Nitrososphaerota archaeon]|nr:hypothetical protein [Nitrososphaerota archaeon]